MGERASVGGRGGERARDRTFTGPSTTGPGRGAPTARRAASELSERALRVQTGVAFGAVIAAFVALTVTIPVLVAPQIREAERIHYELGDTLRAVAELRTAALEVRSAGTAARYAAGAPSAAPFDDARAAVERGVATLESLAARLSGTPLASSAEWARLRDAEIPRLVQLSMETIEAGARGMRDAGAFRTLIAQSEAVDHSIAALAASSRAAAASAARGIHLSLTRIVAASIAAAILGGLGALLLLRRSLGLMRTYVAETHGRLAELDAFASRVAHDLRTPLQTVKLALARLRRGGEDPVQAQVVARAAAAVRRLEDRIAGLLEFARAGGAPRPGSVADVGTVVDEVLGEFREAAEARRVALIFDVPRDLRAAMAPPALHSLVANLVENGIKYARGDGEQSVRVRASRVASEVELVVEDTGTGIAEDAVPSLFEPFHRGRTDGAGYGLGLATVKRLVESHGGRISLETQRDVGTTFLVRLPAAVGDHLPHDEGRRVAPPPDAAPPDESDV